MAFENLPIAASSAIAALEYDSETETVAVTFTRGQRYLIDGMPELEVYRWANSSSPGSYWNSYVKGMY